MTRYRMGSWRIVAGLLITTPLAAQILRVASQPIEDGLPQRNATRVAEDRFGLTGMVAKRKLRLGDIAIMEHTETAIPRELTSPKLIAEKTMLRGLETAPPASRHDPSNIVRHDGTYYVWWMERDQVLDADGKVLRCELPWRLAFASSKDSRTWTYRGAALPEGKPGQWDDMGFAAPFCVPHEGNYYLFYNPTGTTYPEPLAYPDAVGWRGLTYAVAETPEGPWRKHDKPVLSPGKRGEWDDFLIADVNIICFDNKWWLYYKGVSIDPTVARGEPISKRRRPAIDVGVAVSDNLTGPYAKLPLNPVFNGHAFSAWVHRHGVASQDQGKVFWSGDGARFVQVKEAKLPLISNGWYMPDSFTGGPNPNGVTWGIASRRVRALVRKGDGAGLDNYELYRYECDLSPKTQAESEAAHGSESNLNGDRAVDYLDVYEANKQDGILSRLDDLSRLPEELRSITKKVTNIRFRDPNGLVDWNKWQSDPSRIIYHDRKYHMWFLRFWECDAFNDPRRRESSTAYAVSEDSHTWEVKGLAPIIGRPGDFDDFDTVVPEPIKYDSRFYIFYEAFTKSPEKWGGRTRAGIGLCVADSPEGPWKRIGDKPILAPAGEASAWDHDVVTNPRPMYIAGKWLLYYKGNNEDRIKGTFNGVAIADRITGPYVKYPGNPLLRGHGHFCWRYEHGMLMIPHHGDELLWSEDGIHFAEVARGKQLFRFGALYLPHDPWSGAPVRDEPDRRLWGVESVPRHPKGTVPKDMNWDLQRFEWELGPGAVK